MHCLDSIGQFATRLQVSVPEVQRALDFLHAEPELVLNGVPYYAVEWTGSVRCVLLAKPKPQEPPRNG